jgi:uncharacterized protein YndB with AHSA1/START domain
MNNTKFTANGNVLTVERTFNATLDLVWRAWTEAELLDQWWAPKPWKSVTKSMDFKEGGQRLYAMLGPEGEEHWCVTTYNTISKHHEFTGDDAFTDKEGNINKDFPVAQFKNLFEKKSEHTKVLITTEYATEEHLKQVMDMGMKEGLSMAFENLDGVLEEMDK